MNKKLYAPGSHQIYPPSSEVGIVGWLRRNLFATPKDVVLSLAAVYLIYAFLPGLVQWALIDAVWIAKDRAECWELMAEPGSGACWAFINVRMKQILYGFYPDAEIWRVNLAFILLLLAIAPILFDRFPFRKPMLWFSGLYPFIGGWLIFGWFGLEPVATKDVGGLSLTLIIGVTGISFSLPIGILLALGRTSSLPVVEVFLFYSLNLSGAYL